MRNQKVWGVIVEFCENSSIQERGLDEYFIENRFPRRPRDGEGYLDWDNDINVEITIGAPLSILQNSDFKSTSVVEVTFFVFFFLFS